MLRMSLAAALALFVVMSCDVYAQDSGQETRELVAALDKTKYKKKEKANVSIETYIDIENEAAVRDPVDYGGSYESEDREWSLSLHVERGGVVTGSGFDAMNGETNRRRSFVLKDATINGALLAGTKFYENGEQRRFEAVFVNHTVASGKNANEITSRDTKFGIGFIETGTWSDAQDGTMNQISRVFLERR
jgi:hypothetical protein